MFTREPALFDCPIPCKSKCCFTKIFGFQDKKLVLPANLVEMDCKETPTGTQLDDFVQQVTGKDDHTDKIKVKLLSIELSYPVQNWNSTRTRHKSEANFNPSSGIFGTSLNILKFEILHEARGSH